jgi:hypothetical protein
MSKKRWAGRENARPARFKGVLFLPLSASIYVAASLQKTARLRSTHSGKYSSHLAHGVAQVGFAIFKRVYGFLHQDHCVQHSLPFFTFSRGKNA